MRCESWAPRFSQRSLYESLTFLFDAWAHHLAGVDAVLDRNDSDLLAAGSTNESAGANHAGIAAARADDGADGPVHRGLQAVQRPLGCGSRPGTNLHQCGLCELPYVARGGRHEQHEAHHVFWGAEQQWKL